jgi:hypothetical protein
MPTWGRIGGDCLMDSARHCHDQAAECHRLMKRRRVRCGSGSGEYFPKLVTTCGPDRPLPRDHPRTRPHCPEMEPPLRLRRKPPPGAGSCGGFSPARNHSCVHIAVSSQAQDHQPIRSLRMEVRTPEQFTSRPSGPRAHMGGPAGGLGALPPGLAGPQRGLDHP